MKLVLEFIEAHEAREAAKEALKAKKADGLLKRVAMFTLCTGSQVAGSLI